MHDLVDEALLGLGRPSLDRSCPGFERGSVEDIGDQRVRDFTSFTAGAHHRLWKGRRV